MIAIGVLLTVINLAALDSRRARSPARTRGRRTRSSGSRPSPPPENNFDVIPRVRSVEPMKDIRRQIEQQSGVPQQFRVRRAACCGDERKLGAPDHRPGGRRRVRQVVADYVTLTKPNVQLLLLLTTVTTMYVAGDPSVALVAADLPRRLAVRGRRGRGQPLLRPRHRRPDGPHSHRGRCPSGRVRPGAALAVRLRAAGAVVPAALDRRQRAGRRAGAVRLPRLRASSTRCGSSARTPQNIVIGGAAGRRPAAGRLGRGDRPRGPAPPGTCSRSSSTGRRRTSGRCRC